MFDIKAISEAMTALPELSVKAEQIASDISDKLGQIVTYLEGIETGIMQNNLLIGDIRDTLVEKEESESD